MESNFINLARSINRDNMTQFILPVTTGELYRLDDFIVSDSNQAAYKLINAWPANWGHQPYPYSLLIYGPPSCGKTYLTKIWQKLASAYQIKKNEPLNAHILKSYTTFIIEDLESWNQQQSEVLHYFNLINEHKKYLLFTATTSQHNFTLQDLASRINSIFKVEIKSPDNELIKTLLFKLFSSKSIKISERLLAFILLHISRQFNEILNLVEKVNHFALTHKRNITIPLIKEVMGWGNNNY